MESLIIGEIVKPQGVKGELKVKPITHDVMRYKDLTSVLIMRDGALAAVEIRVTRIDKDAVYMFMDGVHDRNDAEKVRGVLLHVYRKDALKLDSNANFICDLIGLKGATEDGTEIGTLKEVLQPGGNDVYVFTGPRGEVLVPALRSVVLRVDLENRHMLLSAERMAEVAVFNDD